MFYTVTVRHSNYVLPLTVIPKGEGLSKIPRSGLLFPSFRPTTDNVDLWTLQLSIVKIEIKHSYYRKRGNSQKLTFLDSTFTISAFWTSIMYAESRKPNVG